ncbi:MAG: nucleotidyl transferase AbiEii/AbiGii toxin family protein [Deltaproteobacteria bacterium]|nr:nucleotidyl transferase AbiEii/AbiGii toxin family protein [Deltaproteobacteria bacterium]
MMYRSVLPPSQLTLWDGELCALPPGWVLYGGTAIALHLGHRRSVDFDFFCAQPLDRTALRRSCPLLVGARTLQDEPDTLTVVVESSNDPVKLSFFGGIDFGRVGEPVRTAGHVPVASTIDLLGTKLATVTQRIEARDYVDIAALLASGLTINEGVAAMLGLYGAQASGLQSVKTLTWYRDGGLDQALSEEIKTRLREAALAFRPETTALPKRSTRLD